MNALIFAAGLGTRLRPLTDNMPKALVPVAGKPLLERVILNLKEAGFTHIVVNVHHFAQQIIDFVASRNYFGLSIDISDERDFLLDTGGGIKKAASYFRDGKPFLIHNVDIITHLDLREFYEKHLQQKSAVSLYIGERHTSRYLLFDRNLKMKGWTNQKTGEIKSPYSSFDSQACKKYAFNGIHVISPEVLSYMEDFDRNFSIIDFYISVADKLEIKGELSDSTGIWLDVGKPEMLEKASILLQDK